MADLLEKASAWLGQMRKTHLSRTVTYIRGDHQLQVAAMIGSTIFEIDDQYGAVERFESRDFLISAADLILDGEVTQPRPGDQIKEMQGRTFVYEVMSPGKEPCWRYSDSYRQMLRIHTKQVDTEIV